MSLTDTAIRKSKASEKPQKLFDGGGLFLLVSPAGGKWWRIKYRFDGKEKLLSLGTYPEISLKDARERRDEARKLIAKGIDPSEERKNIKRQKSITKANLFETVASEWMEGRKTRVAIGQHQKTLARMTNDVFPWLGQRPISEIDAPEILEILRRVDNRGARYTAHLLRSEISQIFRYAIATGRVKGDPAKDLIGAIPPAVEKHFASIVEPAKVAEMLRAFDGFSGTFPVLCALKLAPMLFVRPGELRKAEWGSINLEKAEWRYRITKTKSDHLVPLASQVVKILKELHALTGKGHFVFPGARSSARPMSDATINAALRRLGYDTQTEITGHGFRAMARTILHEELHQKPEVIEHQLAHSVSDTLGTAYNRTKFLKERRAMMQLWADYLEQLKQGAEIISFKTSNQ